MKKEKLNEIENNLGVILIARKNKLLSLHGGITLISLIITIIILLILLGVTLTMVSGDNGIFKISEISSEEHIKAQIKEELEIEILNIQMNIAEKGRIFERKDLQGLLNIGANLDSYAIPSQGEYKGYSFEIDENYVVNVKEKVVGKKPNIDIKLVTEGIVAEGEKIEIEVVASIEEGTIESIEPMNGAILKEDFVATDTTKRFIVSSNGTYYFRVKSDNGRIIVGSVIINSIKHKPTIEIKDITSKGFTIVAKNNYETEREIKYKYYINGQLRNNVATDLDYTATDLLGATQYKVYVIAIDNKGYSIKSDEQIVKTLKTERLYLYRNGTKASVTGGFRFNTIQNHSVSSSDSTTLYIKAASVYGVGYGEIELYTNNAINLTNYSTIYFDMNYYVGFGQQDWRTKFYYGLSGSTMRTVSGTSSYNGTVSIDIRSIKGSYRPYFKVYSASSQSNAWVTIRQIYLE